MATIGKRSKAARVAFEGKDLISVEDAVKQVVAEIQKIVR